MKATEYMERLRSAKSRRERSLLVMRAAWDDQLEYPDYLAIKELDRQLNTWEEATAHV